MAFIDTLELFNFKSHVNFKKRFQNDKHIVIFGKNGVGKTNLLESLSYFSNLKGLRGDKVENLFSNLSKEPKIKLKLKFQGYKKVYKISYEFEKKVDKVEKQFFLDEQKISHNNIKKFLNFVWLSPYLDKVMYEGNTIKRNFIDKLVSQNSEIFSKNHSSYKKNISERISILKKSNDERWLSIIEEKISQEMYNIFDERRKFAENLTNEIKQKLSNFREIKIFYNNENFTAQKEKDHLIEIFKNKLLKNRQIDEISKRTNFGINTDEVVFFDVKNNLNTDSCSTGEQKSSLLSIILGNCWMMKKNEKDFILLLDEATSHIDSFNFAKLFEEVEKFNTQIWYTGTSKNLFQVIENKGFFIELA